MTELAEFELPENYLASYLLSLISVTDAQVREVISEVTAQPSRRTLIVGDRATLEPKLRGAGLGEVRVIDYNGRPVAPK